MKFFNRKKYYTIVWSYGYDELEKYNNIIKARSKEEACIKLYNRHILPIYIYSIKEGI